MIAMSVLVSMIAMNFMRVMIAMNVMIVMIVMSVMIAMSVMISCVALSSLLHDTHAAGVKCLLEYQLKSELLATLPIPQTSDDEWDEIATSDTGAGGGSGETGACVD